MKKSELRVICRETYSSPEMMGVMSSLIHKYIEKLENANLITHDIIIARHGKIIYENYRKPFGRDFLHRMYSITKSFVSLAIGFLEQDGLINLDAPVTEYFSDELKNQKDENMRNQTIRHMLMMSTAKPERWWFEARCKDRVGFYFENDLEATRPPGTVFMYDSTGSFVLGALVERITKKPMLEYLREKCLDKIGFSKEAYMLKCPGGHSWGDSGLLCTAEDLLKTAMFCMNGGKWGDEQLLNEEYINKAISKQIDNNESGGNGHDTKGYGYQFWRTYEDSYFFNGMGAQLAVCVPHKDMILIYNGDNQGKGNTSSKETIIKNFFEIIVANVEDEPVMESAKEIEKLDIYSKSLKLFSVSGEKYKKIQDEINNVLYVMDKNPMGIKKMKLSFEGDGGRLYYINEQGSKELSFKMCDNEFQKFPQYGYSDGVGSEKGDRLYNCAVSAAWVSDFQLLIKVQIIDTYFGILNINLGFNNGKIGVNMTKVAEDFLWEYEGYASGRKED